MVGIGREGPALNPRRADIHVIAFAEVAGSVLTGPHPAVIVSSDRLNRAAGTVLVCPLTPMIRHDPSTYLPPYLVPVAAHESGLKRDGYVKANQVFTRPVEIIGPRVGRINPEAMDRVDVALRTVFGL